MDQSFSKRRPSEATVEGMGNHALLSELGHSKAWVLTPTQHVEGETGYDGRLGGYRKAVIQYKRPRQGTNEDGFSVGLDEDQHMNLRGKYSHEEAFYCFSDALSYDTVSQAFQEDGTAGFLRRLVFVSVRSIPLGIKTIRFRNGGSPAERKPEDRICQYYETGSSGDCYEPIDWMTGHCWLHAFSDGNVGREIEIDEDRTPEGELIRSRGLPEENPNTGKENHLYAPLSA